MRVLVIGGTGTIGSAIVKELKNFKVEIITAGYSTGDFQVDITSTNSIKQLYEQTGTLHAVICAAGRGTPFKAVTDMNKEDYLKGIQAKLLGQIDVVLNGIPYLMKGGSFTLTSGILNHQFIPKGSCAALVNNALEAFVASSALELPEGIRLNIVSPNLVKESLEHYEKLFIGFEGISVKGVASAYIRSVFGILNGQTLKVW